MTKDVSLVLIMLLCLSWIPSLQAAENDWKQVMDKDGINVSKRLIPGTNRYELRGVGVIDATLGTIAAILLVFWALLHSLLARTRVKGFITGFFDHHFFRVFYVITSGVSLMVVLYLWRPVSGNLWQANGGLYWVLSILYLFCIVGMFYSMLSIDFIEYLGIRSVLRHMKGQPEKTQLFEVKGPYAYCRHPSYLFLLLAFWIGPVMTTGRFEFALIGSLYLIAGTFLEERNLRKELGEVYDLYRANVPMWIPRMKPWHYEA